MDAPLPSPEPDWDEVESLFAAALRVAGVARDQLLARESRRRPRVVAEVRSLLEAHQRTRGFLARPAIELVERDDGRAGRAVGPYRIEGLLGRGGMGTVYRAVRERPTRTVALKVLNHPVLADSERRTRFEREAETLAHLQHPGIATLYETGCSAEGVPFIAMELVRGPTLSEWAVRRRPSREDVLRVFVEICEAVEYAHEAGVVHRDLKPANVIVQEGAQRSRVKVLDLGLARAEEASPGDGDLTRSGSIVGTLSYSSPEQASGQLERVGFASDVYSLGVILYELLTGNLPYDSKWTSLMEAIRTVCAEQPVRPGVRDRRLRGDLETILLKALEKEPGRRYASVRAMRTDVELHLAGRPILARPQSAPYQLRKLVGRNRAVFASVFALLATVSGAVVALSVLYVDARRAERLATDEASTALEVNDFLRRTLSLADPSVAGVPNLGMHSLLDRTAERIDAELKRNTHVAAQVRVTLGEAYAGLGDLERAEIHLRRALTTLRAVLPPTDPELAHDLLVLGEVVLQRGEATAAASLFEEGIDILGEPSTDLARRDAAILRMDLARAIRAAVGVDGLARAEDLLGDARALLDELDDADRVELLPRLSIETASLLGAAGRDAEAEAELARAKTILECAEECDRVALAQCLNALGVCMGRQGRGAEAEAAYRRSSELLAAVLGPEHPRFAAVLDNLGDQITRNGRPTEGERELRRALAIREASLPENHPDLAVTRNHLGHALRRQGELDLARGAFESALRTNREVLGEDSVEVANGEANLAQLSLDAGDAAAAEEHARRAVAAYETCLPQGHWWRGAASGLLGEVLLAQDRFGEAEDVLREATSVVEAARGRDDAQTTRIRGLLARARTAAGR